MLGDTLKFFIIVLIVGAYLFNSAYASVFFETDKENYVSGDTIYINGSVDIISEAIPIATIVISNPNSPFVGLIPSSIQTDGTFSGNMLAQGSTWSYEGEYTISVTYSGQTVENSFRFTIIEESAPTPTKPIKPLKPTPPKLSEKESPQVSEPEQNTSEIIEAYGPKSHILGFPALDKAPQYYIDRYDNEQSYKEWFDSQFPGKSIELVVGYDKSHILGFPALDKAPQHYIDRYDNEQSYKEWFDSQFPQKSIYNVLGFPDPVEIPDWIKDIAEWWSTGAIDDDTFVTGIEFMIENSIIIIPNLPESQSVDDTSVPSWVRNNANWWALDRISEDEFVNAIKFLVEKGIIVV